MFRRGPSLVRVAATTAVVAGTAGAVGHRQQQKYAGQANAQAQDQAQQQQMADMQAQQEALAQQQQQLAQQQAMMAQQAAPPPQVAAPAPSAGNDMMAQLNQLAQLHSQGILSDEEFSAAKAKLLAS